LTRGALRYRRALGWLYGPASNRQVGGAVVRCKLEDDEFDDVEFEYTATHGWVHKRKPLHTTDGDLVEEGTIPGPLVIIDPDEP
jgi:hypothetical protein